MHCRTKDCHSSQQHDTRQLIESNHDTEKLLLQAVDKSTDGLSRQIGLLQKAVEDANKSMSDDVASGTHSRRGDLCDRIRDCQPDLLNRVTNGVNETLPQVAREKFLETLRFESIADRHDSIATAHLQTLSWVLTPGSHQDISWHDFPSWLESTITLGNIYWITGKPGSGKSTLMRYLADSEITETMLRSWAGSKPIRFLRCFFWNPGNIMQKSMEGLLRTLLYQALCNTDIDEDVLQAIAPARWHSFMYDVKPPKAWTAGELSLVFRNTVSALSKHSSLVLFVDGLDEFGTERAEREDLVNMFLGMLDTPNVKMCLSSRPWNEFRDTLGDFPSLRLDDLTRDDMRDFVQTELGDSRAFQDLAQVAPDEVNELQEQLTVKSDGVFLWLHLVTRRLKTAAQDGKSLRKLQELLNEFPPDLDDFFQDMLRRIPEQDRSQTSKIFQLILDDRVGSLPSLMTISFTDEDVLDFALTNAVQTFSRAQILSRVVSFKRRLNSQCMDLLISGSERLSLGYRWEDTQIEYLHRTVKDFLMSDFSQKVLLDYTSGPFDTSRYLCNAFLAQMIFMNLLISSASPDTKESADV